MSRTWKDKTATTYSEHARERAEAIRKVRRLKAQYHRSTGEKALRLAHDIVRLTVLFSL